MNGNKKDALLILSGGMDSVTLLYEKAEEIALAVSFDYGSNHNHKEIPFAKKHCEALGIPHVVIPLKFMAEHFESSLLSGADAIPEGHYADENMKSTVVPFRNGIMLSIAAGLAESKGLQKVMMANHFGDHDVYPDCRKEFVDNMSAAISAGCTRTYSSTHPTLRFPRLTSPARERHSALITHKLGLATRVLKNTAANAALASNAKKLWPRQASSTTRSISHEQISRHQADGNFGSTPSFTPLRKQVPWTPWS